MSFKSKPATQTVVQQPTTSTTVVDPYASMPAWLQGYLSESVGNLSASDKRGELLRQMYSDPEMLIRPFAGQEGLDYITGAAEAGMGMAGAGADAAREASGRAVSTMEGAAGIGRSALDDVIATLRGQGTFDTSGARDRLRALGDAGLGSTDFAMGGMTGAADRLGGISTDLGQAFDTTATRDALTGMDIEGRQNRYEQDYVDQIVNPVMSRMREDEALRLAQLEGANAAIGGSSNTRLAVAGARLSDEAMRSRAQTEAELRQRSLREAQDLGLREADLVGNLTQAAGQLGLSESELNAAIARQAGELGISREQAIANIFNQVGNLGLAGTELAGNMEKIAAELGLSESEAARLLQGDVARNIESQFGMSKDLATAQAGQAGTELAAGSLGLDAGRMGMAAGGVMMDAAERERTLEQEAMQAPLTMESWYRNLVSGGPALAPPTGSSSTTNTSDSTSTTTQSGGSAGVGTKLLGAGTSLLGSFSDERVKDDVEQLDGALEIIRKQRPSVYRYIDPSFDRFQIEGRRSAGLMAQDLEDIPGAVIDTEMGVKMVDPYPVMATIAAAVQELDRKVEAMSHVGS